MNKKDRFFITNLMLALLIFVLLGTLSFMILMVIFQEPHFKITREVCEKKITRYVLNKYPNNCSQLLEIKGHFGRPISDDCNICSGLDERYSYYCLKPIDEIYFNKTTQTCTQEEAEEIDLNTYRCLQNKSGSNECGFVEFYGNLIISKSDLTLDWLEENCNCFEMNICTDYSVVCKNYCKRYKCGDYQVEVWKQLK